jgi:2,3-dihydroxybiphenyl 1,2-dioxygenase
MSISGLGYVAFNVSDLASWTSILTRVFGMQVVDDGVPGVRHFRLDDWHHRITLYETEVDSVAAVGWELNNEDELAAMVKRLRDAGVDVSEADPDLHDARKVTSLYRFIDPASTMPTEVFFGARSEMFPFVSPIGVSGYNTGHLGLGHVVYFVADYAASRRFYTDVLGFRTSDYIIWDDGEKDATFYHCNPRHHSLAIMPPFGDIPPGTFNHLMLEAKSIDDVGRAYDTVRDMEIPLMMEFGKHTNDHTESFYIVTPSGFGMEYGTNSRLVGEDWRVRTYDSPMLWGHREPPSSGS